MTYRETLHRKKQTFFYFMQISVDFFCKNSDLVRSPAQSFLKKIHYINKVNIIFNEGITNRIFIETGDTTHVDGKRLQDFLYRNFKDLKYYGDMHPVSKQTACFFATAKRHKFTTIQEINVDQLKLCPIIDQTDTYTYITSKVVAEFDTQMNMKMLHTILSP